jgi:phosphorylated CTD-interacting factor 1
LRAHLRGKRLIDSKVEESTYNYGISARTDPILNPNVTIQYTSSQRLMDEICEISNKKSQTTTAPSSSIIKRNDAKKIVHDLCRRTNIAVQEIYQQQLLLLNQTSSPPIKKGDRIELEGHPPVYTLVYHRHKKWKKPYCIKINATHYNKLYNMFVHVHGNDLQFKENGNNKLTMTTHIFHYIVMVLLLRYSSLSGGQLIFDLRGGGMQGAVHDSVFDTLHHDLFPHDTMIEGFGSPLNVYLSSFYSAFAYDIDWHFGSRGSFLHEPICEGCCEVNPPFAPGIMNAMADRIVNNISLANERNRIVTFIVIVPHGGNENDVHRAAAKRYGSQSLQQMIGSEHCTHHFILKAKEHGYIEGAQHLRPTRYKESLYDTSIIVLQSIIAQEKREIDKDTFEDKIRIAFASRHRHEVESRKEMKTSS